MKRIVLATTALLAVGTLSAAEKQEMAFGFKLRAQAGLEAVENMRNGFGFGATFDMPLGPGMLAMEVGYQYYSGSHYLEPIPANSYGLTGTGNSPNAVDSRKNSADGLSARLSFGAKISGDFGWQIGAAAAKLKGTKESIANFGTSAAYGGWAMVAEKSALTVSPYAGVTYGLGEKGYLELNVIVASYKQPTITATFPAGASGTNRTVAVIGEKNVSKPKIEICYAFRF